MVQSESGGPPRLKRRALLATMGISSVAGCSSYQQNGLEEDDCVDQSQYEQLNNKYEDLRERYNALQDKVEQALLPPYIVTGQRKISVTYETINKNIDSWEWDSSTLAAQNTTGSIVRELSHSELDYLGFDGLGFEGRNKYTRLGDFGLYYQLNPFVIPSNFNPLAEEFYNRHESNYDRIHEAWNFVTQLNDYVNDIGETPRFPLETLLMGGGDCEDSAILLGSILDSMPGNLEPKFWYIDADYPANPQDINHVIVSAETDEEVYLIETTSDQMLPYDKVDGFSVEISPP